MKTSDVLLSVALAFGFLTAPFHSDAQEPGKVYRIGYLAVGNPAFARALTPQRCPIQGHPYWQAFVEGLRERGYISGQNLVIECRYTESQNERAEAGAAELVKLKVDLIVPVGTTQARAAKQATTTIPIVMVGVWDPIDSGLVANLARPGGNVTGLADTAGVEVLGKHLQLLKEALPNASRVTVLGYSPDRTTPVFWSDTQAAAQALDVTLQTYRIRGPSELADAFAAMAQARAEALLVAPHPIVNTHTRRIVELAAQNRLPAMYPYREAPETGGLIGYGANLADNFRRVGLYVNRIFKGANPGELPVERPTKFDLVINLKTARALGLTIPQSLLMRADEVIE